MQNFEAGSFSRPQTAHRVVKGVPGGVRCSGEYMVATGRTGAGEAEVRPLPGHDRLGRVRSLIRPLGTTCLLALAMATARPAAAQVRPDLDWRTLTTEHFRIHFTPELAELARRTAHNAETAWSQLARELVPPRGPVEIVVADNVDFSNGYATPFPTNRIVVYARPPVEEMALRNHADWNRVLITHELTHIFHLDRVRGIWALGQRVFGRAAPLFPNSYAPRWITEGLAVHYETRLGGGGRLAGTEFPLYARAAALAGELPPLDALSLESPGFPGGNRAYIYGSFAVTRADSADMRAYVEAASGRIIPWRHDANAREAFGVSFTQRWRAWRDSVTRAESGVTAAAGGPAAGAFTPDPAATLTTHGFTARFPRFTSETTLVYLANDAKRVTGLYRLTHEGPRERLGRRNSVDISTPLDARRTVQGELDFRDPYSLRSDLFRGDGLGRRRITRDERLSSPDAHAATGRIVAVRTDPGTTSLVLMDPDDDLFARDVARGTLDRTWAEPRFSRDGRRIAAVRWERGGRNSVVVMDTAGRTVRTFAPRGPRLTIVSSPVFEPGDSTLLFVSDHEGRPFVYRGDVRTGAYGRVWTSATGLNTPDVSPDGVRVAAVELRAEGYHVVIRPTPGAVPLALPARDTLPDPLRPLTVAPADTFAREAKYAPWRLLEPMWWLPVVANTDPGTIAFGGMTGATDVVGRHAWSAEAMLERGRQEWSGRLSYAYAGLGVPVIYADVASDWDHSVIRTTTGAFAGYLGQRSQRASVDVVFDRPRVRLSSYAVVGGEVEAFSFRSYPGVLLPQLGNDALLRTTFTQALQGTVGFTTMQRPTNAVSASDGVTGSVTHRERLGVGVQYEDVPETIVAMSAAKSLPLPGYSHHVFAVYGAYGVTGHRTTSALDVGGVSGSSLEILPGVVLGGSRRTFGVRGFSGGTLLGVRAAAASAEYRMPLALVGRGVKLLPVFLQKMSVTAFGDAGSAWCEFEVANSFICDAASLQRRTIGSVGAELGVDAAVQYDFAYRFRLGVARPVQGASYARNSTTFFFTLGSAF